MNDRMLIRSLKGRSFIYHKQRKLFLKLAGNISTLVVWHSIVDPIALFAGVTPSEFHCSYGSSPCQAQKEKEKKAINAEKFRFLCKLLFITVIDNCMH